MRRFQYLLAIFLIVSTVLSACGPKGPTAVVRIGWTGGPDTLNPGMATLIESYSIFGLIYDTLYELSLDGAYKLALAESVDVSEDGKVWTFKIRNGVKFHDGEPLTAVDVAFSFNFYQQHTDDFMFLPGYTAYFESVISTSNNEVVITLTEAIPNMESQLYSLFVLPRHIWQHVSDPTIMDIPIDLSVGSGPFHLVDYQPGKLIRLESVQNHYFYHPNVGSIEFHIYPDVSSMIEALNNKEIDLISDMPVAAVSALQDLPGIQVVAGPPFSPSLSDVIMNQADPESCPTDSGGLCTGHPALRDRKVRLAMAYATNKQRLVDEIMLGLADPGLTLIPKGLGLFYNSSIKDYDYDPQKANQILDEAGYLDTNKDGIREMPNANRNLTFRLEWPEDTTYAQSEAELLKAMWSRVGISVVMTSASEDDLLARCCPTFDYDILLWGWDSDPDPGFLLSVMLSSEIVSGNNETGYSNPNYDRLFERQATEMDDEARLGVIWQMQDIVHDDVVYIIPFYQKMVQAYRTDTFRGWPTESNNLDLDSLPSLGVIEPISK